MQESEDKKLSPQEAAPSSGDVLQADTDLYGDEADIPLRPRKKKSPSKKSKKKRSGKKRKKRSSPLLAFLRGETRKRHADRPRLFELDHSGTGTRMLPDVLVYGRRISMLLVISIAVLAVLTGFVFLSNSSIQTVEQTVTVVGLPKDLENYRMLVISDLRGERYGDEQSALLRTINNLSYDSVFFLGDMIGKNGDAEPFYELLEGIPSSKEVYFICGDSDPGPFVEQPRDITGTLSQIVLEDWILGAIERGAIYVDSPILLKEGSSNIWITPATLLNLEASELLNTCKDQTAQEEDGVIAGLEADYQTLPMTSYRYRVAQKLYDALPSMSEDDFYLALSHEPPSDSFILSSSSHTSASGKYLTEPELILSGHYCGGVWRIPLLGAFFVPDSMMARNGWFPSQDDVKGLSRIGETQKFITGGLSVNSDLPLMPFRMMNQPEISLLTLTATLPENMLTVN